jgi:hypothetical protein
MRPGEGVNLYGSSALMRHFDGMAAHLDVALREGQLLAGGHADLHLHDVDAGDQFGHRVLDLHPRVHLDEVELAVFVQELEGAGAAVADLRQASAQRSPIALDHAPGMPGAGASSMIFWWRRCIEQSRSPSQTALRWCRPAPGSRCGAGSRGTSPCRPWVVEGGAGLGAGHVCTALISAASVCTTRMPRPPPPPAALMITG